MTGKMTNNARKEQDNFTNLIDLGPGIRLGSRGIFPLFVIPSHTVHKEKKKNTSEILIQLRNAQTQSVIISPRPKEKLPLYKFFFTTNGGKVLVAESFDRVGWETLNTHIFFLNKKICCSYLINKSRLMSTHITHTNKKYFVQTGVRKAFCE